MENCLFCKITKHEIPAEIIYEDDDVMAFLDIMPKQFGHTLVIPKKHFDSIVDTPDDIIAKMFTVLKKISPAILKVTSADSFNTLFNSGAASGQMIFHTHMHIIPRKRGDGTPEWPSLKYAEGEWEEYGNKIRAELDL